MANPGGVDVTADPRITGEHLRQLPGDPGTLTLVGVVHDHPASTYRAQRVVDALDPSVVALELPPISVPLFEEYAATERQPPTFGGEMSAAIQAAAPNVAVGIDRPTGGFFQHLGEQLLKQRPSVATLRTVLSNAVSTTKHAVLCRFAAVLAARSSIRLEIDSPARYDVDCRDPPKKQAVDERAQIRRSRAFLNAFRTSNRSRAARLEDTAREEAMAARLSELRTQHEHVVAVVGIDHLDSLTERLAAGDTAT